MAEIPLERVSTTSPFRCQASAKEGQCCNKRTPNSEFCSFHGGSSKERKFTQKKAISYKLQQFQEKRLTELISDDDLKNLREEIGLLRTLLELLLNTITESGKFVLFADKIMLLVSQIRKTVECTHLMESKTSELIDRRIVVMIAGNAIKIVATYVAETQHKELEAKIFKTVNDVATFGVPGEAYSPDKVKIHSLAKYRLKQHGQRVAEFACDDEVKSVRQEISILRMTLEDVWNSCTDTNKLLLKIDQIQQMVGNIQKTIESAQRMEERTNSLIDRKVVVVIADSMVNVISDYVKDPDALTEIAERICASIEHATSQQTTVGTVA